MAELRVEDGDLVLALTTAEKAESVHPRDPRVPLSAVTGVDVLDNAHSPVGIRAGIKIGTRLPGVIEVGIVRGLTKKLFAAVHHDTPRGVRIRLTGAAWDEWIVGAADPEAVASRVSAAR